MADNGDDANPPADPARLASLAALATRSIIGANRWCWDWRYHRNLHDHIHALGVVAANYNSLEKVFELMFEVCSDLHQAASNKMFASLNNNRNRIDSLKSILETGNPLGREVGLHFLRGFDICADNRNLLMHGTPYRADEKRDKLVLQKVARNNPQRTNYLNLKVNDIRKVADEIDRFDDFGVDCIAFISAQRTGGVVQFEDGTSIAPPLPPLPRLPDRMSLSDGPPPEEGAPPG